MCRKYLLCQLNSALYYSRPMKTFLFLFELKNTNFVCPQSLGSGYSKGKLCAYTYVKMQRISGRIIRPNFIYLYNPNRIWQPDIREIRILVF